ncbi:MAG TPA: transglutaminase domain-containing protein, partial [Arenimonas sp.]|nr:transglutaminase domain-containing protein [Arenimonas sp.]
LVQQWRAEGAEDDEVIRRALAWINRDFSYSLETALLGRHSVDEFLFDVQIGFCEHFSSAFVFLMRAAGIPARVVTGYAGAYRNPIGDFWLVRQSDAHAWTEVWLPERGWVRIDPTAAVAPERVFETAEQIEGLGGLGGVRQALDLGDWARWGWNDVLLQFNAVRQRGLLRPFGIEEADTWQLGMAFAIGAGIALALTLWLLLRGQREQLPPEMLAWRRFERRLARAGWPKREDEPALSYGERLAATLPAQADALRALSRRFVDWRYAPSTLDATQRQALVRDLRAFRPR